MRYLPQFLADPRILWLINRAIHKGGGPVTTLGGARDYAADPDTRAAMSLWNMATGLSAYNITPANALGNADYSGEVRTLSKGMRSIRKGRQTQAETPLWK